MKRNTMENAVFWLVILGPTITGIAACIYYGGSKSIAIWTGLFGVVLLLLAAALQWQQVIWKSKKDMPESSVPAPAQAPEPRAYIQVEPGPIKDFDIGCRTSITVKIKNNGPATAYDVTSDVSVGILPYPFSADHPFPDVAQSHQGVATLEPGAEGVGFGQFDEPLTKELIMAVMDGTKLRLYVATTVSYRLASGLKCKKRLLISTGGPDFVAAAKVYKGKGFGNLMWQYTDRYNDVNKECE